MLVRIAGYTTALEAHLARGRLETEGIPAFVAHEHHVGIDWLAALAMMHIKVYVHLDNVGRATEIVAAHDRGEYALEEEDKPIICPRCHATNVTRHRVSWKSALLVVNLAYLPLYFRWATLRCETCRHEWDLPDTRAHSHWTIAIAALVLVTVMISLFSTYCAKGSEHWLLFNLDRACSR